MIDIRRFNLWRPILGFGLGLMNATKPVIGLDGD